MKQRYNLMLNPKLVYYIDCICNDNGISRSEYINGLIAEAVFKKNLSDPTDFQDVFTDKKIVEEL